MCCEQHGISGTYQGCSIDMQSVRDFQFASYLATLMFGGMLIRLHCAGFPSIDPQAELQRKVDALTTEKVRATN
jgi:hypothetical protein